MACMFIGYNEKYKGYQCYYPPTGRVFISRHVLFDESVYLFEDMYSQYHKPSDSALLNAWRSSSLRKQDSPVSTDPIEEVFPPQHSNVIHIGTIPLVIPSTGTLTILNIKRFVETFLKKQNLTVRLLTQIRKSIKK